MKQGIDVMTYALLHREAGFLHRHDDRRDLAEIDGWFSREISLRLSWGLTGKARRD
ncbi:MAG: hypothetical protein JO212_02555 [Acetobacteraceae bacterium]|nr:hypothetical protein [Acetobacteraceae bacterium]